MRTPRGELVTCAADFDIVSVLLWGLGIPTAVLLLQICWWRVHRPTADVKVLAAMLVTALGLLALLCLLPATVTGSLSVPRGLFASLYALALAGAVSLLYLITYAGLEAKSPSTLIVVAAQQATDGISLEEAEGLFTDEEFIVERVEGLVRIGQLRKEGESLHMTMHGRLFLGAFMLPRKIMGLRHWGG